MSFYPVSLGLMKESRSKEVRRRMRREEGMGWGQAGDRQMATGRDSDCF